MAARETDVMEDEILETELWSSSVLAISSGTEQLLMLEGSGPVSQRIWHPRGYGIPESNSLGILEPPRDFGTPFIN